MQSSTILSSILFLLDANDKQINLSVSCKKVSSFLRKDGGSTQPELFWGLIQPIKLEKPLNNLKCVEITLNLFNSVLLKVGNLNLR